MTRRLVPCETCRRHVDLATVVCPFCGARSEVSAVHSLRSTAGRLSRAAIFAGATLSGCWTSSSSTTPSTSSTPPGGDMAPVAATGSIWGVVRLEARGEPARNIAVTLHLVDGSTRRANTDERGEYRFDDVPVGAHAVSVKAARPDDGTLDYAVTVTAGERAQADLVLDFGPTPPAVKMPYGAPPVRRRVV